MKTFIVLLICAGALSTLAGCKEDKPAVIVQTTDWYKTHSAERNEVITKCNSNPGELAATPNCVNASRAGSATTWGAKGAGIAPVKPLTANEINK